MSTNTKICVNTSGPIWMRGWKVRPKHPIGKFKGGYNYRGYCVYKDGRAWYYKYEEGGREYVRSLRDFCNLVDYWMRKEERSANT